MLVLFALLGALVVGLLLGLVWRGTIVIGDCRALSRLAAQLQAEGRITTATHASLAAMRQVAHYGGSGAARQ